MKFINQMKVIWLKAVLINLLISRKSKIIFKENKQCSLKLIYYYKSQNKFKMS